ncbi:multidrug transporter subunit MdtD [Ottowia beijingensis]|uniref:Multidrug transporter subunit MdtD n=1 Tax=Ottowia beijingensis TaxID=1207057 RepID=A0A853IW96_9BURK|nr:multidrug transporter subunit MdtD [Ottowia beijingensis]
MHEPAQAVRRHHLHLPGAAPPRGRHEDAAGAGAQHELLRHAEAERARGRAPPGAVARQGAAGPVDALRRPAVGAAARRHRRDGRVRRQPLLQEADADGDDLRRHAAPPGRGERAHDGDRWRLCLTARRTGAAYHPERGAPQGATLFLPRAVPAAAPTPTANPRILLWLVAIGFFMQTLDSTIVNTALPAMARSLGESPLRMQAVVVAYALTMAVIIPATGWLADRFGTRHIFLLAIVLFTAGSAACAAAPSYNALVAARVLQGVGGAMLLPVGRLTVLRQFPKDQFVAAMSFVAIPGLMGPLIGPTLGGWLVEAASWHWIFLINIPVGIVGALATLRFMPNLRHADPGRFDLGGYALLVLAMVAISLALDGMSGLGWARTLVVLLLVAGLAALAAYWLHAMRSPAPLFTPALFGVHSYRVGVLGNLFARIGSGAMPYLIPLLMQLAMGFSPAQAGMLMLPVALAAMATKRLVTRIITRWGYRPVLVGNTLLLGALIAAFALMTPEQPLWLRVLQMAVFGGVNSMQFTAMNAVTLKDLEPARAASGNSLFSMVQMLGMSLGVTCAAALLHAFADWLDTGAGLSALPAFRAAFVVIGLMTMLSAAIFWQLDRGLPRRPVPPESPDPA